MIFVQTLFRYRSAYTSGNLYMRIPFSSFLRSSQWSACPDVHRYVRAEWINWLSPKYFLPSEKIFSTSLLLFSIFSPPSPSSALRQRFPEYHVSRSAACLLVHDYRDKAWLSFRPSEQGIALFCLFLGRKRVFFDFFQLFCEKNHRKACRFKNNAYLCTPNSNGGLERGKQPRE